MHALSEAELLSAWDQGLSRDLPNLALIILALSCPESSLDEIARLSIGRRDDLLLTLHEWTFGPRLVGLSKCPKCSESLELDFSVADLRENSKREDGEEFSIVLSGYELTIRPVNTYDLISIAGMKDVTLARNALLNRCILQVQERDGEIPLEQVPKGVLDGTIQELEHIDPQADIRLALSCPSCNHQWEAYFDIVSFFWKEIESWASRLLHEVHTLAEKYGWTESNILAMSPKRRRIYLEMANR